uniref:Uncharacterized protein n=1 Tax=Kalanchoe fedtschenkoi TaxID=63787 RepID=A0A7N0ZZZ8_KALFE
MFVRSCKELRHYASPCKPHMFLPHEPLPGYVYRIQQRATYLLRCPLILYLYQYNSTLYILCCCSDLCSYV